MLAPHRKPCDTPEAQKPSELMTRDTRWVLPATILGSSLSYIDESVVNVALPQMQRSLGASFATMQWVFNGYMLTLASLILLGGAAGDRFGGDGCSLSDSSPLRQLPLPRVSRFRRRG